MISVTMLTAFTWLLHHILISCLEPPSGKLNSVHQITSKRQQGPDVPFIDRSQEWVPLNDRQRTVSHSFLGCE
jgi:hypothetical protein